MAGRLRHDATQRRAIRLRTEAGCPALWQKLAPFRVVTQGASIRARRFIVV
jgi:hypothetical protein